MVDHSQTLHGAVHKDQHYQPFLSLLPQISNTNIRGVAAGVQSNHPFLFTRLTLHERHSTQTVVSVSSENFETRAPQQQWVFLCFQLVQ